MEAPHQPSDVNQYEAERLERIQRNKEKMQQLGLLETSRALQNSTAAYNNNQRSSEGWKPKTSRTKSKSDAPAVPMRASRRLRGEFAPDTDLSVAIAHAEVESEEEGPLGLTRKGTSRKQLDENFPEDVTFAAPFTLTSIGTTIWELGKIHRGAWSDRFWSSSGCLFHHAYPVGYRATKVCFNTTYEMRIEAGPTGPVFWVVDQTSGRAFSGSSPTKPWTEVCLAHKTGQRISGPLYFGFSDPVTQRAIASCLYSPEELQAALAGDKPKRAPEALTAEEKAAVAFTEISGIGPTVGMALANTVAFGGNRHSGPEMLAVWIKEDEAQRTQQLSEWLLQSDEVPMATKQWPAWRSRLVPRIVAAIVEIGSGGAKSVVEKKEETVAVQQQQQQVEQDERTSK